MVQVRHAVDLDANDLGSGLRGEKLHAPAGPGWERRAEPAPISRAHGFDVSAVRVHDLGPDHTVEGAAALLEDCLQVADGTVQLPFNAALDQLAGAGIPARLRGDPDHVAVDVGMRVGAGWLRTAAADDASMAAHSSVAMQSICTLAPFHRKAAPKLVRAGSGSWKRSP